MNYLSCIDAAKKLGVSTRRIQQMCKQGEISNAIKDGRTWLIPDDITLKQLKPLPIGVSDFKSATTNYYYVDKTLMIRDFLDAKPMVSLFTRPRRFGKTLNMDMLRVFFEKTAENTSVYFKDKQIWRCGVLHKTSRTISCYLSHFQRCKMFNMVRNISKNQKNYFFRVHTP